ncbi:alcohol dehydrogenase iron-type [Trichococcus palustris]|uniref:Alcohol dehydrogenase iron-type n=1 Tax=Trichococcus palustris TaxID=140314 RepID=A0A143Y6Q9_9LACT|nr:iron-containing alcohol dehydrogenase family protein [Trichococcus palustris]CZQ81173.1 alcohol dehydrogenase iron-type [Trichococcus palustris]SFK63136.1 uncharacterized oxidoreductase [Trichococcus palustris]
MTTALTVRPGPQEYECRLGVLATLPKRLSERFVKKIVVVHGGVSWQKARPYLDDLYAADFEIWEDKFGGECSYEEVNRIAELATSHQADAIIAVGGGKIMDAVKYAAAKAGCLLNVMVPTLASNCAPWTPLSVMYTEDGVFIRYDFMPQQASILLLDPQLLVDSPKDFFVAGLADTLAKWYESDEILSLPENEHQPMLMMARHAASICRQAILDYAEMAIAGLEAGEATETFAKLAEVIISISGMVGGMGDTLARTTIAHEIHDAITAYPESHHFLHGHKVAYGILVQLAFEKKWAEIDNLIPFYEHLDIPKSLHDLHLDRLTDEEILDIATLATKPEAPVHGLPYEVNAALMVQAIKALENYMANIPGLKD